MTNEDDLQCVEELNIWPSGAAALGHIGQGNAGGAHTISPEAQQLMQQLMQQRVKAEEDRHRAYEAQQQQRERQDREERTRAQALQLACHVCSVGGDGPSAVLAVARDFHTFLCGVESKLN